MSPEEEAKSLDAEIAKISKSTRTTVPALLPLHDLLRQKYPWYYRWHLNALSSKIHFGILSIYILALFVSVASGAFGGPYRRAQAVTVTNCIFTNAMDSNWNNALNWNCGKIPNNTVEEIFNVLFTSSAGGGNDFGVADMGSDVVIASLSMDGTGFNLLNTYAYSLTTTTQDGGSGSLIVSAGDILDASNGGGSGGSLTVQGDWTIGETASFNSSPTTTVTFSGAAQIINTASAAFQGNVTLSGSGTKLISGDLGVYRAFTLGSNVTLDLADQDPNVVLQGSTITLQSSSTWTKQDNGIATTTFNNNTSATFKDSNATTQDLGLVTVGTALTVDSTGNGMKATKATINISRTLNISNETLTLTGTGTGSSKPLTNNGTFTTTGSTVVYAGVTTATDITQVAYNNLELTPSGGTATTYNLAGHLSADVSPSKALSGNLTISTGATLDVRPSTIDYNLTAVNVTINGTLDATSASSTFTASGNWDHSAGTFTKGTSTVTLTGSSSSINAGATYSAGGKTFYNLNFPSSGTTTTTLNSSISLSNSINLGNSTNTITSSAKAIEVWASGTPVSGTNPILTNTGLIYVGSSATDVIGGNSFYNVQLRGTSANVTFTLQGALTVSYSFIVRSNTDNYTSTLNLNGKDVTVTGVGGFQVGMTGNTLRTGIVQNNDATTKSIITTTGLTIYGGGGNNKILANGTQTIDLNVSGAWTNSDTFTAGNSTVVFNGAADQTITTNSQAFKTLTLNNTGASGSDDIITSGNLDVDGTLTVTNGDLDIDTNDPAINTAGNVSIGSSGSVDAGSGTWTFDGTTTYTDNTDVSNPQNLGVVAVNGTSVTLGSPMKADKMTITSGTLDLADSGYTLNIVNAGATGTVFACTGTLDPGTNSTVKYSATNSAGTVTVDDCPYNHLQLSGAETYDLAGNLTGAKVLTGNLTIDANATLDVVNGSDYGIALAGNWANSGTFTPRSGTVDFTKGSDTQTLNSGGIGAGKAFNNLTHSGAGTLQLSTNALDIDDDFTNSAGTFDANDLNINVADDFLISGGSFSADVAPGATTQTVTFDSTNTAIVSGSTTFNNLTMDSTAIAGGKTITFTAGTTQTISAGKTWTLDGAVGNVLTLNSSTPTSAWNFNISAGFTSGDYIDVKDSNSANANKITPGANVTDSGNNLGWNFAPYAPTAASAVNVVESGATSFNVTWTDNSYNETGFKVYVSISVANNSCTDVGTAYPPGSADYTTAANATSQLVTGKSVNTQYCAKVIATNDVGDSSAAYGGPLYTRANTPAAPTVTVQSWDAANGNSLAVVINANSNPAATEFAIACNSTPDSWLQGENGICGVLEVWRTKANWETGLINYLTNLPADTDYTLLVKARNGDNLPTSNSPTNGPNKTAPAQPTGLTHTANTTTTITWNLNDNAVAPDGYHLLNNAGDQTLETSVTSDFVQDQDDAVGTPLTVNTSYTVRTRAYRGTVNGQPTVAGTTAAYTSIETPTGITFGTIATSSIQISASGTLSNLASGSSGLYFTETTGGAGGGGAGFLAWTQTNDLTDSGLSVNTQYTYKVKARNGDSDETPETATANKYTYANVPLVPTVNQSSSTSLGVIINVNSNPAATEFAIYNETLTEYVQADGSNGAAAVWQNYATWGGAAGITNTGLTASTIYSYKTKGRNGNNVETSLSNATSQTTLSAGSGTKLTPTPSVSPSATPTSTPTGETSPGETSSPTSSQGTKAPTAPSNLRATSLGAITLTLAWDASTDDIGVSGYEIYNPETGIKVGTTAATTFDFSGLTPNSTYKFYIRAYDVVPNYGPNSEILTITTSESRTAEEKAIEEQGGIVAYLVLGGIPKGVGAGQPFPDKVKITAADVGGKIVRGYSKATHFTSTDALAKFAYPESHPYTFTTADAGIHEFEGSDFILNSTGNQQITVSDQSTKSTVDVKVTSATATVIRQTTTYVRSFFTDPNKVSKANIVMAALIAGVIILPTLLRFLTNFNNLIPQLIYGLTHIFQILGLRRRRKIWGVVFNAQTGQPIPFAMVKLKNKNNQIAEISISDSQGRYGFALRHGSYHLEVFRADYIYPTEVKTSSFYERIYTGTEIKIAGPTQHIVFNIALDPHGRSTLGLSLWIWLIRFNHLLQKIRLPLFVLGMLFALVMIMIDFGFIYFAFLVFCVLVALLELFNLRKVNATGVVTDVYARPIYGAIVRIYHKEDNRLIDTDVSSRKGHFVFKVSPGIYYLMATKPKYIDFKSHLMYLQKEKKKEAISSINIKLRKE